MPAALFIITSSAEHKLVNRLLLHLRDWEYGEDPSWDNFHLITTDSLPEADSECTKAPIKQNDLLNNIWANKTISDVESFIISERNKEDKETELNLDTFVILDEQGVKDGTIILLDSPYNEDDDKKEDKYKKVRVPWEKAYIMWCNLDIGNMDFEEFIEFEEGHEGEWFTYTEFLPHPNEDTQKLYDESASNVKEKREKAIADLEEKGMA